ncbi:MAG: beta-ACP synthase [Bacteroidetes bacterium CG2_30_32_10]|nr:MAG: beta-ACP synthase [Bacteroidetes bacterium CG2_30_32_10]
MSSRVFVTGLGIISSIGCNIKEVMEAIYAKKSGISEITILETNYKGKIPVCEVKKLNKELAELAGVSNLNKYTRTALLGIIAAKQAVAYAGIDNIKELRTGVISATSVGGMDRSENFYQSFYKDQNKGRLRDVVNHDCSDSTEKIADILGISEYITTISTACSSSANAIMLGARLIKNNFLDRVIVGGTDALTRFTLNGFNSLMILDATGCKPFDNKRNGLTIGEGAGFLVIESEKSLKISGKKVLAELTGYGNACDAFHQTASSPEGYGAYLAMKKAIEVSGKHITEIDYINAHGTGTANNDLTEGKAIEKIFNNSIPEVSSTKAYTGHTLAASGGIEAVLSVLAIKEKIIYPNLRFTEQINELSFSPTIELLQNKEVRNVLSNSFGFGGNNTSLVFSKY